eukprot:CAMPEP_0197846480 /NCGR_PEP_ID=MMETSP1438-20131217/3215_1 /TAXON_ID=1461541 /ORGANISM="Pterosperma sp., Strain CCMP1384" /LENGTH=945 /DNA_ID=CAMNT_0043458151 /DNA_START=398 /DNA_END=3233 /DNA_ORIENTATION=+
MTQALKAGAAAPPTKRRRISSSEKCGYCHHCANPKLKKACITARRKQEEEEAERATRAVGTSIKPKPDVARPAPKGDDGSHIFGLVEPLIDKSGGILGVLQVPSVLRLVKNEKSTRAKYVLTGVLSKSGKHLLQLFVKGGGLKLLEAWLVESQQPTTQAKPKLVCQILKALRLFPVTLLALQAEGCNIGRVVASLKKHESPDVRQSAIQLVGHWKQLVTPKPTVTPVASGDTAPSTSDQPSPSVPPSTEGDRAEPADSGEKRKREGGDDPQSEAEAAQVKSAKTDVNEGVPTPVTDPSTSSESTVPVEGTPTPPTTTSAPEATTAFTTPTIPTTTTTTSTPTVTQPATTPTPAAPGSLISLDDDQMFATPKSTTSAHITSTTASSARPLGGAGPARPAARLSIGVSPLAQLHKLKRLNAAASGAGAGGEARANGPPDYTWSAPTSAPRVTQIGGPTTPLTTRIGGFEMGLKGGVGVKSGSGIGGAGSSGGSAGLSAPSAEPEEPPKPRTGRRIRWADSADASGQIQSLERVRFFFMADPSSAAAADPAPNHQPPSWHMEAGPPSDYIQDNNEAPPGFGMPDDNLMPPEMLNSTPGQSSDQGRWLGDRGEGRILRHTHFGFPLGPPDMFTHCEVASGEESVERAVQQQREAQVSSGPQSSHAVEHPASLEPVPIDNPVIIPHRPPNTNDPMQQQPVSVLPDTVPSIAPTINSSALGALGNLPSQLAALANHSSGFPPSAPASLHHAPSSSNPSLLSALAGLEAILPGVVPVPAGGQAPQPQPYQAPVQTSVDPGISNGNPNSSSNARSTAAEVAASISAAATAGGAGNDLLLADLLSTGLLEALQSSAGTTSTSGAQAPAPPVSQQAPPPTQPPAGASLGGPAQGLMEEGVTPRTLRITCSPRTLNQVPGIKAKVGEDVEGTNAFAVFSTHLRAAAMVPAALLHTW